MEHFDTDTLSLGRRTPTTPGQRAEALAGIAACNREWHGAEDWTSLDDMTRWTPYRRAGYQLRHLELALTLPDPRRYPVPYKA